MALDAVRGFQAYLNTVKQTEAKPGINQTQGLPQGKDSFGDVLTNAMKEVDGLQRAADEQIEGVTLDKPGFTSHGAVMALEKADVAFQLMNSIRAKIVRAYEDVLRTQI